MILSFLYLVAGFAFLLTGADWLVKGGSSLAKRYNVPEIVIGLTIVAFGTSTPELVVNLNSNLSGAYGLTFGDPIGSNIVNILLILGLTALIYPLQVQKATTWKEIPFAFVAAAVVMLLCNNLWLTPKESFGLQRLDSLIMLLLFSLFLIYTARLAMKGEVEASEVKVYSLLASLAAIVFGLAGLVAGGKIVVTQAIKIATQIGISQKTIGLTIVAIGTSLPELATSITAALKKHPDIAIGNIVGSNIFNILLILGISSLIHPIPYNNAFNRDFLFMFGATALLYLFMFTGKKHKLDRWEGGIFVLCYIAYTIWFL